MLEMELQRSKKAQKRRGWESKFLLWQLERKW